MSGRQGTLPCACVGMDELDPRSWKGVRGQQANGLSQASPGQRPGLRTRRMEALKGRYQGIHCAALSGLDRGRRALPGRCPGLACAAPSGRERNRLSQPRPVVSFTLLVAFVCLAAFAASADAPATNHWAFQPIRLPPVPTTHQSAGWVQTPIDAFILAKLEERGLVPSPSADARTLVRRLHFDLLGLPPSVEEVEAFAAAFPLSHPPTFSPAGSESGKAGKRESERQAVAVLVDKLLASP
jgi:hypothetical protein